MLGLNRIFHLSLCQDISHSLSHIMTSAVSGSSTNYTDIHVRPLFSFGFVHLDFVLIHLSVGEISFLDSRPVLHFTGPM